MTGRFFYHYKKAVVRLVSLTFHPRHPEVSKMEGKLLTLRPQDPPIPSITQFTLSCYQVSPNSFVQTNPSPPNSSQIPSPMLHWRLIWCGQNDARFLLKAYRSICCKDNIYRIVRRSWYPLVDSVLCYERNNHLVSSKRSNRQL